MSLSRSLHAETSPPYFRTVGPLACFAPPMLSLSFSVPALSAGAHRIAQIETVVVAGGAVFVAVVLGLTVSSLVRSRARPETSGARPAPRDPTGPLTAASAAVALVVAISFFSLAAYAAGAEPPENAIEVEAHQSDASWSFTYANGAAQNDKVLLPLGRHVALNLVTDDDPSTFVVPELGLRTQLVRGDYRSLLVEPTAIGTAHIVGPAGKSVAEIEIVSREAFDEYMRVGPSNPYCPSKDACPVELAARWGEDLYAQNACIGCHTRDGSRLVGPSFKGVYGRNETMTTGLVVHIDDAYLLESIRQPQAKIVKGYENGNMPSFASLSDRKVDALIAYLKTVK